MNDQWLNIERSVVLVTPICIIIPKTKMFGCIGKGDLTFLFKSCEIDKSQGRLVQQRGK